MQWIEAQSALRQLMARVADSVGLRYEAMEMRDEAYESTLFAMVIDRTNRAVERGAYGWAGEAVADAIDELMTTARVTVDQSRKLAAMRDEPETFIHWPEWRNYCQALEPEREVKHDVTGPTD